MSTSEHSISILSSSSSGTLFIVIGCVSLLVLFITATLIYLLYFSTEQEDKPAAPSAVAKTRSGKSRKPAKTIGKTGKQGNLSAVLKTSKMISFSIKEKNKNMKNISSTASFKSSIFGGGGGGKYSRVGSSVVSEVAPSRCVPSSAHIAPLPKEKGLPSKVHPKLSKSVVGAPPSKMDARFGSMNAKLLLDVVIDQPSKSALDTPTTYSSISQTNSQVSSLIGSKLPKGIKPEAAPLKVSHKRSSSIGWWWWSALTTCNSLLWFISFIFKCNNNRRSGSSVC